jgi:hypothetical protein
VRAVCDIGRIEISVEAEADEPFSKLVGESFDEGMRRSPNSNVPERIRLLASAVLERQVEDVRDLRYQLLYGTAAALSVAKQRGARAALFVAHEFVTECTDDAKHRLNMDDLNKFVGVLNGTRSTNVPSGVLLGPFRVPGNAYIPDNIDLFVGKAVRFTRRPQKQGGHVPEYFEQNSRAEKTYRAIGRFIFAFSQVEYTIRHYLGEAIELKEDYFTPVIESYDVAMLCKVALEIFAKQRSGKTFDRIKKEIDLFMRINNEIRTRVAHGLWNPHNEGGTVGHVPRSLKAIVSPNQAEELEKVADQLFELQSRLENAIFDVLPEDVLPTRRH